MINNGAIVTAVHKQSKYVIKMRRKLHRIAETGGHEIKTGELIIKETKKLGLPFEKVSTTGLLVTLDTGRPGNGVALRADMDALPMKESPDNLKVRKPCVSDNPETCHSCGHDAHVAMMLGAMRALSEIKDSICGRIYFCFEEGEEVGSGWQGMVDALKMKQVNTVWAIHVEASLPAGLLAIDTGARMGGTIGVAFCVNGRGGHGSRPDLCVNPVFCAANMLTNLSVAFVNQIDANETVTLGITTIQGGGVVNVIPDYATVMGTLRFFSRSEGQKALRILKSVCDQTAVMNGCTIDYLPANKIMTEVTINDDDAVAFARREIGSIFPKGNITSSERWFSSESYSEYLRRYKGAMGFLGIQNEEKGCGADHHNEHFDIDEDAMVNGVLAHVKYACSALGNSVVSTWGYREPDKHDGFVDLYKPDVKTEPVENLSAPKKGEPKYNLDSKIGDLLKSDKAKIAVNEVIKGIVDHPQIKFVKGFSIRKAARFLPDRLTPGVLAEIEKALAIVKD